MVLPYMGKHYLGITQVCMYYLNFKRGTKLKMNMTAAKILLLNIQPVTFVKILLNGY